MSTDFQNPRASARGAVKDDTQPEAMDLADWLEAVGGGPSAKRCAALLRAQHARIAELESELEAVGAGGVSGPLIGQPQAMPDLTALTERGAKAWAGVDAQGLREGRWYMVTHDGVATLCEDRRDAEKEAKDADMAWPHSGPHRAVQLVEASTAGFTAADMATAEARGFRDGVASLSANAGEPSGHLKEPYTLAEIKAKIASNDYSAEMLLQHAMLLLDSASLAANAGSVPVAWRAQFDEWWVHNRVSTHQVKNVGGFAAKVWHAAIQTVVGATDSTAGFYPADEGSTPSRQATHPSPPEGMAVTDAMIDAGKKMLHNSNGRGAREKVERIFNAMIALAAPPTAQAEGWTKASKQLPPCRGDQLYIGINTAGFAGVFNAVRVVNGNTYCLMEVAEESVSIMSDLAIWKPFNPPTSAEGVEHG